ncbi:MAG: family 20 glycosylhydrolase [Bacteroidales bacterium]|nr:family 20 glycosylhydrolase [Bacteroidales bacterium]MDY0286772.1 family 20 glycosylhydrolase [Bacteroidales bacterium]HPE87577.1 family 20 glycosylhydrolase [Bacteroidales bacterium]
MIKKGILPTLLFVLPFIFFSCSSPESLDITPKPVRSYAQSGKFEINRATKIAFNTQDTLLANTVQWFIDFIENGSGLRLTTVAIDAMRASSNTLIINARLQDEKDTHEEGYFLNVKTGYIQIQASTPAGVFYAFQTLRQMMPPELEQSGTMKKIPIPCAQIKDYPEYVWRGMHLDVSRHFFPVEFVKRYIDLIAFHKMNVFHWHLTDDNGWRIEIRKYPLLQEVAAWRVDREQEPWREVTPPLPGEKATYGGFYTQEEIKEIVAYAAKQQVMVIPEIEMPGHSCEVLAAYPALGCTGGPYYVQPGGYWPNDDIFCAGNDEVFEFLENVLDEVIPLFPAPYFHIGGDEATKTAWASCPKCQKRMREENLKDVEALQSWFIQRMEKYLKSKGKKLIGWDEILQGGLAPEATVMSWQGTEGGIEAARTGHDAIMCPISHCYLNFYQADAEFQPEAIGGFTTLKKVYSFNPKPAALTEEEAQHILGGQGNLWTEWIDTPELAEYMVLPRMTALSEKLWRKHEDSQWDDFRERIKPLFKRFDHMGVRYSDGSYKIEVSTDYDTLMHSFRVTLSTEAFADNIFYTLDNTFPDDQSTAYTAPFILDHSATLKAIAYKEGSPKEKTSIIGIELHQAIGKAAVLRYPPDEKYTCEGVHTLVNGLFGSLSHTDGQWLGFKGKDMEITLDFGKEIIANQIRLNALAFPLRWIFLPNEVEVAISDNNHDFHLIGKSTHQYNHKTGELQIVPFIVPCESQPARFVKITAKNAGILPDWHDGAGNPAWLFIDEVVIEP